MPRIEIDQNAGFCFGVDISIKKAEEALLSGQKVYAIGAPVHNQKELERLIGSGLHIIDPEQIDEVEKNAIVLFRAHGESPATYEKVKKRGLQLIDGTCPIVLKLQSRIRQASGNALPSAGSSIIYGDENHPEVKALKAQQDGAEVIMDTESAENIPLKLPLHVFAQTTVSESAYAKICQILESRVVKMSGSKDDLFVHHSICKMVSGRAGKMQEFAEGYDAILFVASKTSSNGRNLYKACKGYNENTFFVEDDNGISESMLAGYESIGISGATSTPMHMLMKVKKKALSIFDSLNKVT